MQRPALAILLTALVAVPVTSDVSGASADSPPTMTWTTPRDSAPAATSGRGAAWGRTPPARHDSLGWSRRPWNLPGDLPAPEAALHALGQAYADRSLDALGALFSADFRFHTNDPKVATALPVVISRDQELEVAAGMFHGRSRPGQPTYPPADSIAMIFGGLTQGVDPEHPDSTDHYRVIAAQHFALTIHLPGDQIYRVGETLQVFHLVRGDAAVLLPGQPADSTRWYIRHWFEDMDRLAVALSQVKGDCGVPEGSAVPADTTSGRAASTPPALPATPAALALSIHPLGNPACPTLDIRCDLPRAGPADLDVFDVMGRRVNHVDVAAGTPGTRKIQAGAGAALQPGAYWIRLTQAGTNDTRMVVVAR
jgi:hypothetical protein